MSDGMADIRYSVSFDTAERMDTAELRRQFLIEGLFDSDGVHWVYALDDRMMVGGCAPRTRLALTAEPALIGGTSLLARRELVVFNIGGDAVVSVGEERYELAHYDALYVGMTTETVGVSSVDPSVRARLYLVSAPAHHAYPTCLVRATDVESIELGAVETCNRRTLRKYIVPGQVESCQLVLGHTTLHPGSVWNTMPTHTHVRRMESYLYLDMEPDTAVFHFMGRPTNTRHIVVRNGQAVISPAWSIHSGAGTGAYSFVWAMAGENQEFSDMDAVPMQELG